MELNLSNASLQTLPSLFETRYRKLNVSFNRIRVLWEEDFPRGVEEVSLEHNSVSEDGLVSTWPDTIHTLNISDNPIYSLSQIVSWPLNLRSLNISYTHIQSIRYEILPATLQTLIVSHTNIREISGLPAALKELRASNTNLYSLPRTLPAGLEILEVNSAFLKNGGLPRKWGTALKHLSLTENYLNEIPVNLPSTLESLNLSSNQIQRICAEEKFPPHLQILHLGHNVILQLPTWFANVSCKFTIHKNKLTERIELQNCLLSHTQWNTPVHIVAVETIQRVWRRSRMKRRVRAYCRTNRVKSDLLALAMNPDRAGIFENIEGCWNSSL